MVVHMNKEEAKKLYESEKDFPVKSRIFKHKINGNFETQILMLEINKYEEVHF